MSNDLDAIRELRRQLARPDGRAYSSSLVQGLSVGAYLPQLTLGMRGFQVRAGEETQPLLDANRRAFTELSLVIVAASPFISRAYYQKAYDPATVSPPDCSSLRGDVPEPTSPHKQSDSCHTCPMAEWGSSNRENSMAKACRETKRLVVAAANDLECRVYGAPFLFVVPPGSLTKIVELHRKLTAIDLPEWAVVLKVGYDPNKTYPAVTFDVERALTLEDIAKVWALRRDFRSLIDLSLGFKDTDPVEEPPEVIRALLDQLPSRATTPAALPHESSSTSPASSRPAPARGAKSASRADSASGEKTARPAAPPTKPTPSVVDVPWDDEEEDDATDEEDPDDLFARIRG